MDETVPTPRGNPYKFTKKRRAVYLTLLRDAEQNLSRSAAAEQIGISRWTATQTIKNDPAFAAAVELAEDERMASQNVAVKNALFDAARSGNIEAIKLWLFNRDAENWRDVKYVKRELDLLEPIRREAIARGYDPDLAVEVLTEVMQMRQAQPPLLLKRPG